VPAAPLPRRPGSSIPEHGAELRGPRALHRPRRRLRRLLQQGGPRGSPPMAGATVSCLSVAESRFTPWPHRSPRNHIVGLCGRPSGDPPSAGAHRCGPPWRLFRCCSPSNGHPAGTQTGGFGGGHGGPRRAALVRTLRMGPPLHSATIDCGAVRLPKAAPGPGLDRRPDRR